MRTQLGIDFEKCIFLNSNSFGVFSHSKGFGAELLLDSLWFFGEDPSWATKRFRFKASTKVSPRFHQGPTKVQPRFFKFRGVSGSLGQIWAAKRLRERFHQGSSKAPPRFHQGFTKVPPSFSKFRGVSGSLGQIRPWAAKRFILGCQKVLCKVPSRFHRGSLKVSPRLRKFRDLSGLPSLLYICLPVPSTLF